MGMGFDSPYLPGGARNFVCQGPLRVANEKGESATMGGKGNGPNHPCLGWEEVGSKTCESVVLRALLRAQRFAV